MREEYERKLREMSAGGSSGNKAEVCLPFHRVMGKNVTFSEVVVPVLS